MKINSPEFWKQRIDESINDLRLAVYHTSPEDWNETNKAHQKIIKEIVSGRVLDAGCAYGRVSEWVDDQTGYTDYTGVDISPDFIDLAKRLYPERKFLVGDLKDLPFGDKEFDWAVCVSIKAMVIRELGKKEWLKIKKELLRVAKKVLILEYSYKDKHEIITD